MIHVERASKKNRILGAKKITPCFFGRGFLNFIFIIFLKRSYYFLSAFCYMPGMALKHLFFLWSGGSLIPQKDFWEAVICSRFKVFKPLFPPIFSSLWLIVLFIFITTVCTAFRISILNIQPMYFVGFCFIFFYLLLWKISHTPPNGSVISSHVPISSFLSFLFHLSPYFIFLVWLFFFLDYLKTSPRHYSNSRLNTSVYISNR